MASLWMQTEVFKEDVMVVDCGYLENQTARDRADKIFALGVSRGQNLSVELMNRVFVRVPKRKRERVLAALPIVEGQAYFGATHRWNDGADADGFIAEDANNKRKA